MNTKLLFSILAIAILSITVISAEATHSVPDKPTNFHTTEIRDYSISLAWTAPTDFGLHPFSHYTISYSTGNNVWSNYETSDTSATINGLQPETIYHFNIKTYNNFGWSSNPTTLTVTTLGTLPGIATNLDVNEEPNTRRILLNWLSPGHMQHEPNTDFIIQYKNVSDSTWITYNDGTSLHILIYMPANLFTLYEKYEFKVATINDSGQGYYTDTVEILLCGNTPINQPNPARTQFGAMC